MAVHKVVKLDSASQVIGAAATGSEQKVASFLAFQLSASRFQPYVLVLGVTYHSGYVLLSQLMLVFHQ
jgi:hypothetical protein